MAKSAKFVLSAPSWRHLPPAWVPEVAFCGRSNVGKSTLVGAVLGAPGMVRTSRTPGRTQLLNYFDATLADARLGICDLPGYGWARLSHVQRRAMEKMVGDYLQRRAQLVAVVLLVDGRRDTVSPLDVAMYRMLVDSGRTVLVAATKCDTLPGTSRGMMLARIGRGLGGAAPLATSARSGMGVVELVDTVRGWVLAAG